MVRGGDRSNSKVLLVEGAVLEAGLEVVGYHLLPEKRRFRPLHLLNTFFLSAQFSLLSSVGVIARLPVVENQFFDSRLFCVIIHLLEMF